MNMMQLLRNTVFLFLLSMTLLVTPASAAYMVTLTNGETISAEDYKINDRTIELKMEGGSASFRRSLVVSISAGGTAGKLSSQPSYAKAAAQSPVRAPGITEQKNSGINTLQRETVEKGDSEAEAEPESEEGVKPPEDDMTVGEFIDKEGEDAVSSDDGDESVDAADQDGDSEDGGFMPEDADQGDNAVEE
jgi:hypothetical protein